MTESVERVCRHCRRPPRGCECPPRCGYCGGVRAERNVEPPCCMLASVEDLGHHAHSIGARVEDSPFLDAGSFTLQYGLPAKMCPQMHRAWVRGWNSE